MTRAEEVYAETLDMLGSDVNDQDTQDIVDHLHELADPRFKKVLEKRRVERQLVAN